MEHIHSHSRRFSLLMAVIVTVVAAALFVSPIVSAVSCPGSCNCPGDPTGDCQINAGDITQTELCILDPGNYSNSSYPGWDSNEDSLGPNAADILATEYRILEKWPINQVHIEASDELACGANFTATVHITRVEDFDAATYDIIFNSSVLEVASAPTAGWINFTTIPIDGWSEPSGGVLRITNNVSGTPCVTGSGYLAKVYFHITNGSTCDNSDITFNTSACNMSDCYSAAINATWVGDSIHLSTPCGPTPTPTVSPSATVTESPTPSATVTESPTVSPTPTPTPTATETIEYQYDIYMGQVTLFVGDKWGGLYNQTRPMYDGVVNISFSTAVVNNTRTFTMDASSFDHTAVFFPDMLPGMYMDFYLNLSLDEDAMGTLYVNNSIGDVDVFSETHKTSDEPPLYYTNTTIGDTLMDAAGSLLLPVALNGSADVYNNITKEYVMTVQLAMPGNMTTNNSGNTVIDDYEDGQVMDDHVVNASGIPFAQSGGAYDYVGTNGKVVTTVACLDAVTYPSAIDFQAIIEWWLCQGSNCPTPTPTPSATVTESPTPSATVTESPTPSATVTESPTPSATVTESPTPSATVTESPTPSATVTESPTPSATVTESPTPSATVTESPTPSATVTESPTPCATVTESPTPSATVTESPTPSATVTESPTPSATVTESPTPSATVTESPTPSATVTESPTPSATVTESPTPSATVTESPTPSATVTESPTPSATVTESPTPSATVTESPTPSATVTESPTPSATVTESPTPSATVTESPTPSATVTESPTPSATVTESPTPTPTASPTATATTPTTNVYFNQSSYTVTNGSYFQVRINITDAMLFCNGQFDMCWNNSILQFQTGSRSPRATFINDTYDRSRFLGPTEGCGVITYAVSYSQAAFGGNGSGCVRILPDLGTWVQQWSGGDCGTGGDFCGVQGSGNLTVVTFRAISPGTCNLSFTTGAGSPAGKLQLVQIYAPDELGDPPDTYIYQDYTYPCNPNPNTTPTPTPCNREYDLAWGANASVTVNP